jgi:hypothetical protein
MIRPNLTTVARSFLAHTLGGRFPWLTAGSWLALWLPLAAHSQVVITEFMASNATGLRDEDGAVSDWVELQNSSTNTANLAGWFLTDDPTWLAKWQFPATNLPPDSRLIVFASGKNRSVPGANLHTNFRLAAGGGFLALSKPDGVVSTSRFTYARQFPDVSFGFGLAPSRNAEALLGPGATMRYVIPTNAIADGWHGGSAFDDAAWPAGVLPAGFDVSTGAVTTAFSTPANTPGNQAFGGSLGMDFNVLQPLQVTALGCFDDLGNGVASGTTITVQLWRRADQGTPDNPTDDTGAGVLASSSFTSASPGTLSGGNRFKTLTTPLTLTNGAYTIVAYGYNGNERNGNNGGDFPALKLDSGGALTFVRSRWGDAGAFPTVVDAIVAQYGAGTFRFQALPNGTFATSLLAMRNTNASALSRAPFVVSGNASFASLSLRVSYDDGFVAWLNGMEIARRNAPATLLFNSAATKDSSLSESIDVSAFLLAMVPGTNILALQGLNRVANDTDFRLDAALTAERIATNTVYFLTPTPGAANASGVLFPHVLINEINCNPPNAKSAPAEFVELFNPLPTAVDLSGWTFTKGISFTFPPGIVIGPGGYLVLAQSPAVMQQQFGVATLGPWTGSLANDGETLELMDALGTLVDSVSYGVGFPWPTVGNDPGNSLQLINESVDHDLGGSWRSALPTPGARNVVTTGNAPPQVRQVAHTPAQPAGGEIVTITAKVSDPEGVNAVAVEYQIVAPGRYVRFTDAEFTNDWASISMRDDGMLGDAVAGDGIFTAQMPASVQAHRRLIRYTIAASDFVGNTIRVPYNDDPSPNFAYFVYNGIPPWTGAVQPGVTPPATFGTNTMRKVHAFHLISRNADVMDCQYNSAYNDTVYHFEGALVVDGVVYDHIHYRVAGQGSTYVTGKNKWKFRFNGGHGFTLPDDYGQRLATQRQSLKLSALTEPWAPWNRGLAGLDEAVADRLYNLAGVPAPKTAYFQLRVVDDTADVSASSQYEGDLWGLYLGFEEYDEQFKEEHLMADGNLFLLQGGNNRLGAQGASQPDDLSDLNTFTAGYNASPTQPLPWWRTNVNLPGYYTWRAITEAISNTDIREQENVAYFRNPTNGLWSIHPWDSDLLYEQFDRWGPQGVQNQSAYEQIRRCLEVPAINVEFQNRARELQDLLLNVEQVDKLVDEFVSLLTDGGTANPGFVEVDRRMWDWHPRTSAVNTDQPKGQFYRTPFPIPNMSYGPYPQPFYRTLASPDFAGQVRWVKDFIVADPHGGGRLAALAYNATIPETPAVTYTGQTNFPADGLSFSTTPFHSPTNRVFTALQWRLGEVYDPTVTNYIAGTPWRYEIQAVWDSGELAAFASQIAIPASATREGHTYRARSRFQDSGGCWSHWSTPMQFTVSAPGVGQLARNLIVSEIMYDPPSVGSVDGAAFEFLELKNIGPTNLNLGGLTFTTGITFTFPLDASLASGAFFLLVRDPTNFANKYPGVAFQGIYAGKLDNAGETLTLTHPSGATIFTLTYGSDGLWPSAPHGLGFSLVPVDSTASFDMSNPANWQGSSTAGGTPGTDRVLGPNAPTVEIKLYHSLTIQGQPGLHYRVEYRDVADPPGGWQLLVDIPSLPAASYIVYDPSPAIGTTRSYRVLPMP